MVEPVCIPAQECDIAGIQRAAFESWHATYAEIFSLERIASFLRQGYSTDGLREALRGEGSTFMVAKEADRVVGFEEWGVGTDGPELFRLYIVPSHWRRGLGSRLLELMEQEWRARGVGRYCCLVHELNGPGQAFYLGHGFARDESKDRDDHWYLSKPLQEAGSDTALR